MRVSGWWCPGWRIESGCWGGERLLGLGGSMLLYDIFAGVLWVYVGCGDCGLLRVW